MTNPGEQSLEDLLFTEEYWQGQVIDPLEGLARGKRKEMIHNDHAIAQDPDAAQEIGRIVMSLNGGGTYTPLEYGTEVIMPFENDKQVTKVVTDRRIMIPKTRKNKEYLARTKSIADIMHSPLSGSFDEIAQMMVEPTAYVDLPTLSYRGTADGAIIVSRDVGYLRASGYPELGALLPGINVGEAEYNQLPDNARAHGFPAVSVGDVFSNKKECLVKIVSASVIEASGLLWTDGGKNSSTQKKSSPKRFGWLPLVK
jgi:hypothetical protein